MFSLKRSILSRILHVTFYIAFPFTNATGVRKSGGGEGVGEAGRRDRER